MVKSIVSYNNYERQAIVELTIQRSPDCGTLAAPGNGFLGASQGMESYYILYGKSFLPGSLYSVVISYFL